MMQQDKHELTALEEELIIRLILWNIIQGMKAGKAASSAAKAGA